jgi:Leucine-rich repeat (LRR) protein
MYSLQILRVSSNRILSLPAEVAFWGLLAELRMNDNGLQRLPETLGLMTSLEHAGFANNAIDSFPAEVRNLIPVCSAPLLHASLR